MLEVLQQMFVGKTVEVSHSNKSISTDKGVCLSVKPVEGRNNRYWLEIQDCLYDFEPATLTENSVHGPLHASFGGTRTIKVLES